jgi:hypothetical protein
MFSFLITLVTEESICSKIKEVNVANIQDHCLVSNVHIISCKTESEIYFY